MSSTGTILASGTRASLRYCRESTRNATPAALTTPVTSIGATATAPAGAGFSLFTRASGSFVDDGFFRGQKIVTSGFTNAANNGTWRVWGVTATVLSVLDDNDVIVDETAATAQTARIALSTLRATGRNVNLEKNLLESEEVDADGMETDVRHGFNRVVGSPGFQLSREDYDDFIEFAMGREWDTDIAVTGSPDMGVSSAGGFTRAAGSFITDGFRPGDIIRTTLFDTANNGDWRVTAVAATELSVVSTTDGTTTPSSESEASGKSLVFPGKRIDIGTDICTFLLERAFSDISEYQVFNGVAVNEMQLSVEPESIIGGSFGLLGMSAVALASSSTSAIDPIAANGTSPLAAFDGEIYEGGTRYAVATSLDFTLSRNRSLNPVIGSRFSPDVFGGQANIQGTLNVYFENETLFNKFVNETESTIWTRFDDPNVAGEFMSIVFPRVK